MKVKITVLQSELTINNSTASMMADRFNRCLNIAKEIKDGKVIYTADSVPRKLFSNEEFQAMLMDEAFEFEGLILYAPVTSNLMDLEVPEYFPNSLVPEKVIEDENGKVTKLADSRQCLVSEYFPRSAKFGDKAKIEIWPIRPDKLTNVGGAGDDLTTDYTPNRLMLGMYLQFIAPHLIKGGEFKVKEGMDILISEWVETEQEK